MSDETNNDEPKSDLTDLNKTGTLHHLPPPARKVTREDLAQLVARAPRAFLVTGEQMATMAVMVRQRRWALLACWVLTGLCLGQLAIILKLLS